MTWKRFTRFRLFVRETTDLITQMPAFTLSLSLALTSWVTTSQDAGYIHKTPYHTCDVTIFYFLTDEDINRGENILPSLLRCHIDTHECHMGVTAIHRKLFLNLFRLSLTTTIIIWGWGVLSCNASINVVYHCQVYLIWVIGVNLPLSVFLCWRSEWEANGHVSMRHLLMTSSHWLRFHHSFRQTVILKR